MNWCDLERPAAWRRPAPRKRLANILWYSELCSNESGPETDPSWHSYCYVLGEPGRAQGEMGAGGNSQKESLDPDPYPLQQGFHPLLRRGKVAFGR
jgi:hypothetical protein